MNANTKKQKEDKGIFSELLNGDHPLSILWSNQFFEHLELYSWNTDSILSLDFQVLEYETYKHSKRNLRPTQINADSKSQRRSSKNKDKKHRSFP